MTVERRKGRRRTAGRLLLLPALFAAMTACSAGRSEGMDVDSLPESVRGDYELFAIRCSKCHSLARPLESGITDDGFWKEYVDRMRRQPSSGISPADEIPILRFLHYYSAEKRASQTPASAVEPSPRPEPPQTPAPKAPAPTPDPIPSSPYSPAPTSSAPVEETPR